MAKVTEGVLEGKGGLWRGHRRTKGGGHGPMPPLFLGHFVKDFTKDFFLLDIGPPQSDPPTFELLCTPLGGRKGGEGEGRVVKGTEGVV